MCPLFLTSTISFKKEKGIIGDCMFESEPCYKYSKHIDEEDVLEEISLASPKYIEEYMLLPQKYVDYMVKKDPYWAVTHLNQHPLLTQEHIDIIVEKQPYLAAMYFNKHSLLTKRHVDYIVIKNTLSAVKYLSHRLSKENIAYIAENRPELLKELFNKP